MHGNPKFDAWKRPYAAWHNVWHVVRTNRLARRDAMESDDRLIDLLVRWEDAAASGDPPAPEVLCRACPELEPEFRRLLAGVGAANALLGGGGLINPEDLAARGPAGRYRPLGFHAAGGLGVVYTAEDGEVGRTVALKFMQDWVGADDAARCRFVREAEVTGTLEHPGVVPVYGMGQDDAGRPYYAMRFVCGDTLATASAQFHTAEMYRPHDSERTIEFRRLLRAFITTCETVAYAHARGVVHRDIKPANILLGPYGETLLIDWGLAKRVGAADPTTTATLDSTKVADVSQTLAGVATGTPAYMSPEQARGEWEHVGPPADVFSLGATLYEILTGRPPFESPSALEKAQQWRFLPPRTVLRIVPQPLEAICLRAMARGPENRYEGAADMARDVDRWLADEPVSAWREPLAWRARRWATRHRTLITTTCVTLIAGAAVLGVMGILLAERNRDLKDANYELEQRNSELAATQTATRADFDAANLAVNLLSGGYESEFQAGRDVSIDPIRIAAIRVTRDYYREFRSRNEGRKDLRLELAKAAIDEAEAEYSLGQTAASFPLLDEAIRNLDQLLAERPGDSTLRAYRAWANARYAFALEREGARLRKAHDHAVDACEDLSAMCSLNPPLNEGLWGRAGARGQRFAMACLSLNVSIRALAAVGEPTISTDRFLKWFSQAEGLLDADLASIQDQPSGTRLMLAGVQHVIGESLIEAGRTAEGRRALERAATNLTRLLVTAPGDSRVQHSAAIVNLRLAELLFAGGNRLEAVKRLTDVQTSCQEIITRTSGVQFLKFMRTHSQLVFAQASLMLGEDAAKECFESQKEDAAKVHREKAVRLYRSVRDSLDATELGTDWNLRLQAAGLWMRLGRRVYDLGLYEPALECLGVASKELDQLPTFSRASKHVRQIGAVVDGFIGLAKLNSGGTTVPELDRAVTVLGDLTRVTPGDAGIRHDWLTFRVWQGWAAFNRGESEIGIERLRVLRSEIRHSASEAGPESPDANLVGFATVMLAQAHEIFGMRLSERRPPDHRKALEQIETAILLLEEHARIERPSESVLVLRRRLEALKLKLALPPSK
ncbi:MAG: hypothetical protein C0467_29340 [Planctomycetaceae bacterium]|nr:hypothetical protein [Planctomycetaceae bacterium]